MDYILFHQKKFISKFVSKKYFLLYNVSKKPFISCLLFLKSPVFRYIKYKLKNGFLCSRDICTNLLDSFYIISFFIYNALTKVKLQQKNITLPIILEFQRKDKIKYGLRKLNFKIINEISSSAKRSYLCRILIKNLNIARYFYF